MPEDSKPVRPPLPDYSDEISEEQMEAIRRLVDAGKPEGFKLTPIGPPGW